MVQLQRHYACIEEEDVDALAIYASTEIKKCPLIIASNFFESANYKTGNHFTEAILKIKWLDSEFGKRAQGLQSACASEEFRKKQSDKNALLLLKQTTRILPCSSMGLSTSGRRKSKILAGKKFWEI